MSRYRTRKSIKVEPPTSNEILTKLETRSNSGEAKSCQNIGPSTCEHTNASKKIKKEITQVARPERMDAPISSPSNVRKRDRPAVSRKTEVEKMRNSAIKVATFPALSNFQGEMSAILLQVYSNILGRLRLGMSIKCLSNLVYCAKKHSKNSVSISDDSMQTKLQTILTSSDRPLQFLQFIYLNNLENKMPSHSTLHLIFELILGINHNASNLYDIDDVIQMAVDTFNNILTAFPPCWLATLPTYREFIATPYKNELVQLREFDTSKSLFENIINLLDSLIHPRNESLLDETMNKMINDSQDSLVCFASWESQNKQNFSFDDLHRNDKIKRVFYVIKMIVQLFEIDLTMWTARNLPDPHVLLFDTSKSPLINSVLWSNHEPNQINYCIKTILRTFINYISIDFAQECVTVLARLTNVIFNIFELNEIRQNGEGKIKYPVIDEKRSHFCEAMTNIIYENSNYSVGLWLKIIEYVIHPNLKLKLIAALFTRIEKRDITLNPERIYPRLRELENEFEKYLSQSSNNNTDKIDINIGEVSSGSRKKYPCMLKTRRRAASDLSYEQQIKLYLIALNSYMEVHHTEDVWRYLKECDRLRAQEKDEFEAGQAISMEEDPVASKKKMKKSSFGIRLESLNETGHIHDSNIKNKAAGVGISFEIDQTLFRNDIKFIDLISKKVPKIRSKFDDLFPILH